MWKYVTRRLRDTVERTCQQFDVTGIWPCEKFIRVQYKPVPQAKSNPLGEVRLGPSPCYQHGLDEQKESFRSHGNEDFKHRMRYKNPCILRAIGISYALLFGWYASQYLFLHRRKLAQYCKYKSFSKNHHWGAFCHRRRAIPVAVAVEKTLNQVPCTSKEATSEHDHAFDFIHFLDGVSDTFHFVTYNFDQPPASATKSDERRGSLTESHDLGSAVSNFMTTVAESAYQLALQSLQVRDYSKAVDHLKTATGHNHAGAMFNLGICYEQGLGVQKDLKMAVQCYMAASSLGHSKAMYNLGVFYVQGLGGLKKNRRAAMHYFSKAANLGQPDAKEAIALSPMMDEQAETSVYDYVMKNNFVVKPVAIAI